MSIAEIAGGIILALSLVAFWRVLLPVAGAVLLLAAALSYGHMAASRHARAPDTAPVAVAEPVSPAARHDRPVFSGEGTN